MKHHKSLALGLVDEIKKQMPDYFINIPLLDVQNRFYFVDLFNSPNVTFSNNSYQALRTSKVGIIKSGTSNLESALLGLPFVMFYKTSFVTYQLAKRLINIDKISIVNILLGRKFIPEFIQNNAHPKTIIQSVKEILNNGRIYEEYQKIFVKIRSLLGNSGASEKAAKKIIEFFNI